MAVRNEARKIMSWQEEKPPASGDSTPDAENSNSQALPVGGPTERGLNWANLSPDSPAATEVASYPPAKTYPEDLQISWSWGHLFLFGLFALTVFRVFQVYILFLYSKHRTMSVERFQQYLMSRPEISVGSNLAIFVL